MDIPRLLLLKNGVAMGTINWTMGCIQYASFTVIINGSPSCFFRLSRGIIQGFPLSPFLFLLIAEPLIRLMHNAKISYSFKGIKVSETEELSHILFVDDVLMMEECSIENIIESEQTLELYKATRMHINVEKTILSENYILETVKNKLEAKVPYILKPQTEGFKYLGFNLKPSAYSFKDCKWLYKRWRDV